jgi:hypothetical protein
MILEYAQNGTAGTMQTIFKGESTFNWTCPLAVNPRALSAPTPVTARNYCVSVGIVKPPTLISSYSGVQHSTLGLQHPMGNCRIYVPSIKLENNAESALIAQGISKKILFDDYFQSIFGNPKYSAAFLFINGFLLIAAERLSRRDIAHEFSDSDAEIDHRINAKNALVIGFGQSLALFAGISRFGITMSAGLLRKLNHSVASDFAFLMALPVILGASIVKLPDLFTSQTNTILGEIFVGCVVSFVATYFSVKFLVRWFKTKTLYPFAIYCVVVGFISFLRFY